MVVGPAPTKGLRQLPPVLLLGVPWEQAAGCGWVGRARLKESSRASFNTTATNKYLPPPQALTESCQPTYTWNSLMLLRVIRDLGWAGGGGSSCGLGTRVGQASPEPRPAGDLQVTLCLLGPPASCPWRLSAACHCVGSWRGWWPSPRLPDKVVSGSRMNGDPRNVCPCGNSECDLIWKKGLCRDHPGS